MRRDGWSSRLKIHRTLGVLVSAQIQSTPYCSGRTLRPITTFSTDNTNDGPKPNLSTVDAIPGHPPNLTDMMQLYQFSDKPTANKTEREPTEVPPTPVESSSAETSETSPTVEAPVAADSTDSPEEVETMVTEKKVRAKRVRLPDEPPRFHPKPPDDWLNPDAFRDDVGTDVSLSTLLFHQSTPNTAVSHVRSVDKVVDDMPLYTVDAKKWIFLKTGWLQAVDEYERRHASYKIESEGDAGGEDSSMKNDTNEGSTSEKLPDGDATPTPEESLNATPEVLKPAKDAPPSTHMDVIGRAKVMRYLLYKFFKHQELWFDQMQELIALATKEVLEESGVTGTKEVVWPLPPQFTRSRVQHVNLFSLSVLERFSHILTMRKEKLQEDDPKILWDCFLLQHALDPTLLPSPNRAPFSFGELQPSISESDVELLRYDFPPDDRLEVKSAKERTKTPADFTEKEWESLNDWQKNCILFNSLSANVASAAVRGNSGIYVVHNYDAERPAADRGDPKVTT
ncbi:hypothetical protein AGDE_12799 [Angomonas deanei]|nr:hypothetical protein AGDE_12799 [Angomonas deanei]|eukprot:EPY23452.1 hypothetical protein AGDE_12799 [Angomonas deanei]